MGKKFVRMLLIHILIHLICVKDIRIKKSNYLSKVPTLIKLIFPPKAMWMLQLFWNQHSHLHIEKVLLGNRMALLQEHFLLLN